MEKEAAAERGQSGYEPPVVGGIQRVEEFLVLLGIAKNPPEESDGDDDLDGREKMAFEGLFEFFIPLVRSLHDIGGFGARANPVKYGLVLSSGEGEADVSDAGGSGEFVQETVRGGHD